MRDVTLGTIALCLVSPLIAIFGLAARRSTGGSALFRQVRVGKDGRHFKVSKLRTLPAGAPQAVQKKEAEHLAPPIGTFMRRFKIDELPQFWNVVKGDMSLIGPRPIIPEEYPDDEPQLRLAVRPGVTGLWQLSRVREEPFDRNPEYDLFYLANRSITFDFWLMWRTLLLIVTGRETKIRLAARLWERNNSWRELVPDRARSIPERDRALRSHVYAASLAALLLVGSAPGIASSISARSDLVRAQQSLVAARTAAASLDAELARVELSKAADSFNDAKGKLSSWMTGALRLLPGLNNNIEVPLAFATAGESLVRAGSSGIEVLEALPFKAGRPAASFTDGTLDLAPFIAADKPARRLQAALDSVTKTVEESPTGFLLPAVADARRSALSLLDEASSQADLAADAAFLIPRLFGAGGPRNWVIGAENTAELRGRGGYIGSLGILTADSGSLALADFQPTSELPPLSQDETQEGTIDEEFRKNYFSLSGPVAWQNLLMTPDFPTGARMLLSNLDRVAGIKSDGLIAMDPVALSYLLRATGPVEVPGIPEPLSADNIVDWSLNKIYFLSQGQNDERKELLSVVAATVWNRLLSEDDLDAAAVVGALGRSLSERHLVLYSSRPDEQSAIERLGIAGQLKQPGGDYLLVLGQNVAENKMDYYLARDIRYFASLHADGTLDVELRTTVTHTAPAEMEFPRYIGGGRRPELPGGHIRTFMATFVPGGAELRQVTKNGKATTDFEDIAESNKRRFGTYVELAPGESQTVSYYYRLPEALKNGRYRLLIQNQATVIPDQVSVSVRLPDNASVSGLQGLRRSGDSLNWQDQLHGDTDLAATVELPFATHVVDRLTALLRTPAAFGG